MDPEKKGYEDLSEEGVEAEPAEAVPAQNPVAEEAMRYVPYHNPEEKGIIDKEGNMIVGTDQMVILAKILNKLDNIEKSVG